MATSLTVSARGGGKNLICGVCREVYRSPRLLPCFHTFCLYCLEGLTRAQNSGLFPCPECRKPTTVPPQGALGFQMNFYITEDELEYARKGPSTTMCTIHHMEPLVFFCVPCDQAICIRCRLTKHSDHHETQDLSEAAARCSDSLEKSKDRLDSAISFLSKQSTGAQENLRAVKEKAVAVKEQVYRQHGLVVQKIEDVLTMLLDKINVKTTAMEETLTQDAQSIQKELDCLVQLRQSVHHALTAAEASDAEKVFMEKEMREGKGSEANLCRIQASIPTGTFRPGLHVASNSLSSDDILHVLGDPVTLYMPFKDSKDVIVLVFQYKKNGDAKAVYWLCQRNSDIVVVYMWDPSSNKTIEIHIDENGKLLFSERITSDRLSCKRYEKNRHFRSSFRFTSERGEPAYRLNSKGYHNQIFQVQHLPGEQTSVKRLEVSSDNPFMMKEHHVFDTNPTKPAAFDASSTGNMFALIELSQTGQSPTDTETTKRQVGLYRSCQSTPFATYTSQDTNFYPSDVCFWRENDQDRLLVADRQNDCVHVLSIHEDEVHFQRYLAAGDSNLVRPTALNVDDKGRVWIGCENGSVLRCETLDMESKAEVDGSNAGDDTLSVATDAEGSGVGSVLMVENSSAPSQTSDAAE